jgi:hypothetical protein
LNVKGKSSKKNRLSGFVPFLQIHENEDKQLVETSPIDSRVKIFYQNEEARKSALEVLQHELEGLAFDDPAFEGLTIICDDTYGLGNNFGLDMPEAVMREAYIMRPDISFLAGWETGRSSEPAFMNMNLHAIRGISSPKVVLYQYDEDCMNPHGLLIAYAELSVKRVKPVVSDFDTFTVGSRNMHYGQLAGYQTELAAWSLDKTANILRSPGSIAWNSRWLRVLEQADEEDFHPVMPAYGFGDPTSYGLISSIVKATCDSGAVRHGAECFNFFFPQQLDSEYLIVWGGFQGQPWTYQNESGLRDFLIARAKESFDFPLNPVWPVRDPGWYDVFTALRNNKSTTGAFDAWYPPVSGMVEKIDELRARFPDGFTAVETGLPKEHEHHCDAESDGSQDDDLQHDEIQHLLDERRVRRLKEKEEVQKQVLKPSCGTQPLLFDHPHLLRQTFTSRI